MKIKIEIDCKAVNLRKYVAQTIAKEVVKIFEKEKQEYLKEEPLVGVLMDASIPRLIKCWIRLVWPGTRRHLSQYPSQRQD